MRKINEKMIFSKLRQIVCNENVISMPPSLIKPLTFHISTSAEIRLEKIKGKNVAFFFCNFKVENFPLDYLENLFLILGRDDIFFCFWLYFVFLLILSFRISFFCSFIFLESNSYSSSTIDSLPPKISRENIV